jgi:hypothetical protein
MLGGIVTRVPVTLVSLRFRSCMPTGRFNCPMFPVRKRIERGARRQEEGGEG